MDHQQAAAGVSVVDGVTPVHDTVGNAGLAQGGGAEPQVKKGCQWTDLMGN